MNLFIIGTRGSKLARAQAGLFREMVSRSYPLMQIELKIIATRGDALKEKPSRGVNEKNLFTKELEDALLHGEIDVAVHSGKDLASKIPPGLVIGAVLQRGDRSDAFCSIKFEKFNLLPQGATIGTSSIRRKAQLLLQRPDLRIESLRGNVDTRLRSLAEGKFDALILATCGLERLGLENAIRERFSPKSFLPAPAQGAIVAQYRSDRDDVVRILKSVSDDTSFCEVKAERALLERLEAGCWVPLGASAEVTGKRLALTAGLFSPTGERSVIRRLEGDITDPVSLGWEMAKVLIREGGQQILDELRNVGDDT